MLGKHAWRWAVALAVAAGAWASCAPAAPTATNFRFQISDKLTIYAQVQGSELRMAATKEDLAKATPVKAQGMPLRFPETPLPIPTDMLPAGCTGMKAAVMIYPRGPGESVMVISTLVVTRVDDQKTPWTYYMTLVGPQTNKDTVLQVPALDKLTLEVVTKDMSKDGARTLGVGLHLKAGKVDLTGVQKNGAEVNVQVKTTDSAGKEIASVAKPLSSFGFS